MDNNSHLTMFSIKMRGQSFDPKWNYDEILKRKYLSLLLIILITIYDLSVLLGIKKALGIDPEN